VHALRAQLSWTHLQEIVALDDPLQRRFYEGWTGDLTGAIWLSARRDLTVVGGAGGADGAWPRRLTQVEAPPRR
jgi:hypothetical protein